MQCSGQTCNREAVLVAVDALVPVADRRPIPVCTRHAMLWYRRGEGSIWIFAPGENEAGSLTEEQIAEWQRRCPQQPLSRREVLGLG